MTIPRKGSRRITVDEVEYRWRIRQRPTYSQGALGHALNLAVELAEEPQSTLIVELAQAHPCNWLGDPSSPVTPKEVADRIRQAIAAGWNPSQAGGDFRVTEGEADS